MSDSKRVAPLAFEAYQTLLLNQLREFLSTVSASLSPDLDQVLQSKGKLLASQPQLAENSRPALPNGAWPLLTLLIAKQVNPEVNLRFACNVALAVELLVCAIDQFDDVIDDDQTPQLLALGVPRLVNIATALTLLAPQAILASVSEGVAPEILIHLLSTLAELSLRCIAGQHSDLNAEAQQLDQFTVEQALEISATKSGSLMSMACLLGAICGEADDQTCQQVAELGSLLGLANQLDNDSHDLYHLQQNVSSTQHELRAPDQKSDLARGKKTVPIVLAARSQETLQKTLASSDKEKDEARQRFWQEGVTAAWGMSLLYRERAKALLHNIESLRPLDPMLSFLLGFD